MEINTVVNSRHRSEPGLWTIRLAQGRIAALERQTGDAPQPVVGGAVGVLDAGGGLVTPALVDAHVHLDLAYSLGLTRPNQSGTLWEAIELWRQVKPSLTAAEVRARAERAIRTEVGFGAGFLRSHVDVSSAAGLRLCEGVLAARDATREICKIQTVAFPQDGLVRDPGAVELVRGALRRGVDLVGGIPHIERTPRDGLRHLELVFELAAEFNAAIDVHIDETDDPQSRYTEHLAALTIERGWHGRVTASHACALASYTDVHAARIIDLLAEARIGVVACPAVNLFLQGRFDRYPKRRGLTRVSELLARGVKCAAGQDCIQDPFYPLGTGQLLEQAWLLIHADHLSTPERFKQAGEMVCCMAGDVIGLTCHDKEVGSPANLCLFPMAAPEEIIRLRPRPTAVIHGGRLVAGAAP